MEVHVSHRGHPGDLPYLIIFDLIFMNWYNELIFSDDAVWLMRQLKVSGTTEIGTTSLT